MSYADLFADISDSASVSRDVPLRVSGPSLSDEQMAALRAPFNENALILAGAGGGKTRLLTDRAAELVESGVDPARICVVTFTRKAADEIKMRLLARVGDKKLLPVCGTVHAVAMARLASEKIETTLINDDESTYFLDLLRAEFGEENPLYDLSDQELLLALNRVREEERDSSTLGMLAYRYEEMLAEEGVMDFTSLLKRAALSVRAHFDYILVDEAQDLSSLQQTFLKKIGRKNARYWFIGDADQSIYAFRGATGGVMKELEKLVDKTYVLSVNYRSVRLVVGHAYNVISKNPGRFEVKWKANREEAGSVEVQDFAHGQAELDAVRDWLKQAPEKRAALARTNALIETLKAEGLPAYTVHETKGLEYSEVWVMGCEAALFPHPLGTEEEERRLFYVAMTRARDRLILSHCATRATKRRKGQSLRYPSGFLFEMNGFNG